MQEARHLGLHCGIRPPTYTTAGGSWGGGAGGDRGAVDPGYGHASTIVSIVQIPVAEGSGTDGGVGGGGAGGMGGMPSLGEANSFQVASLDDRGTVSIWRVSEAPRGDEGGSQVREQEAEVLQRVLRVQPCKIPREGRKKKTLTYVKVLPEIMEPVSIGCRAAIVAIFSLLPYNSVDKYAPSSDKEWRLMIGLELSVNALRGP